MPQEQHGLGGLAAEVYLQMVAEVLRVVEANLSSQFGEFAGYELGNVVGGGFVVAGRFDFYQLADGRDDGAATVGEIGQAGLSSHRAHAGNSTNSCPRFRR